MQAPIPTPIPTSSAPVPPSSSAALNSSVKVEDNPLMSEQRQLHPRAVWLFFFNRVIAWIFLGAIIASQVALIFSEMGKTPGEINGGLFLGWFLITFVIIIILAFVVAKLSYRFYRFELTAGEYKAERGIIWKRYISIPYERIQNVDIYRGVLDRLLGLSDLNIQTAGYGAAGMGGTGGSEGRLPGLDRQEAEKIREELIKRAKGAKQAV